MKEKLDVIITDVWNAFADFLIRAGMAIDVSWVEYKEERK